MIIIAKYIFCLGAHIIHMPNVQGLCDVMSIWSWVHVVFGLDSHNVSYLVMGICQAYVLGIYVNDACNSCLSRTAQLLQELLEAILSIFRGLLLLFHQLAMEP